MWNKRSTVLLLAGLNIVLLAAMFLSRPWLPRAWAQSGGRGGAFMTVTAKGAGQSYDVLYVLDQPEKKLHAFYPGNVQTRELTYAGFRNLKDDFGQP